MAAARSPQQKSLKATPLLLLLLLTASLPSSAQPPFPRPATKNNEGPTTSYNTSVSPTLSILIVAFLGVLFLLIFFFIYIRCCHNPRSSVTPTAIPIPSRHAAAQSTRGLDPSLLETFPTMSYSDVKGHKLGKTPLECAVCLSEFEDRDTLRFLPICSHVFHRDCVDVWLASHATCPVCRRNLAPDPSPAAADRELDLTDLVRIGSQRRMMGVPLGDSLSRGDWEAVLVGGGSGEDGRFRLQLPEDVRREIVEGRRLRRSASLGGSRRGGWVWRSLRLGHSARCPVLGRSVSAAVEGFGKVDGAVASSDGGGGGSVKPDEGAEV